MAILREARRAVEHLSFLSKPYIPSRNTDRLGELEQYVNRQNSELYVLLTHLARRVEDLEKQISAKEAEEKN